MNDQLRRLMDLIDSRQSDEVKEWATTRAESGDADAQFLMGYLASKRHEFRESCDWFNRAAAQDHPEALFEVSRIDQSEDRANWGPPLTDQMRTYLRRAADLGSVEAWTALAGFLAEGRGGFPKDEREAEDWYEKAATAGSVDAQCKLSSMLMWRKADPASVEEGIGWLEKAASHDRSPRIMEASRSSEALSRLVTIYTRGFPGVPADPEKAAGFTKRIEEYRDRLRAAREALRDAHPEFRNAKNVGAVVSAAREPPGQRAFAYENATEAKDVLRAHMTTYRQQTHKDLAGLVNKRMASRLRSPAGTEYDVMLEVRWDDQPLGDVFVYGTINDHGWRACQGVNESFSKAPDGRIVGDSG
ncbi:MAG TPA: tetratricopeptide repeat protein [Polyangia bacterium]|nr:tetratricopeptide repeat protein [Polyangia bacterium]